MSLLPAHSYQFNMCLHDKSMFSGRRNIPVHCQVKPNTCSSTATLTKPSKHKGGMFLIRKFFNCTETIQKSHYFSILRTLEVYLVPRSSSRWETTSCAFFEPSWWCCFKDALQTHANCSCYPCTVVSTQKLSVSI